MLVTGNAGFIGQRVVAELALKGHQSVGFDLANNQDIRDFGAVRSAAAGCGEVIHLAAADIPANHARIVETNVSGSDNVIGAAAQAGVRRVVLMSSAEAFGVFMGEAVPAYFPIDQFHPANPKEPYGQSKLAMERNGQRAVAEFGLEVICLRPPGVCDDSTRKWIRSERQKRPEFEWDPIWEYGAWIHVEDLAQACVAACFCEAPDAGFASVLVAATDNNSDEYSSRELAQKVHPEVPWRGGREYQEDPRLTLYRPDSATDLLGWSPSKCWR